jgi:hypothetical protein
MPKRHSKATVTGRKKGRKAKAPTAATRTRPSPELRKKFASVLKGVAKDSKEVWRGFRLQADKPPTIDDWPTVKQQLQNLANRTEKRLVRYDDVAEHIRLSSDEPLKQCVRNAEALGFRDKLAAMHGSLVEQEIEALAPVSDEDKKQIQEHIRTLVAKAAIVHGVAGRLHAEIAAMPPALSPEQEKLLLGVSKALGRVMTACVDLAANVKPEASDVWLTRVTSGITAIREFETVIDEVTSTLQVQAERLKERGRPGEAAKVTAFAARIASDLLFGLSIIDNFVDELSRAIHIPKEAAAAAQKISVDVRVIQSRLNVVASELASVSDGRKGGDAADPRSIPEYHDLAERERIVVALFQVLRSEEGPAATLGIDDVVSRIQPDLASRGIGARKGTIGNIVRTLVKQNVLADSVSKHLMGYGGAKMYRLTEPAAAKYPSGATAKRCSAAGRSETYA